MARSALLNVMVSAATKAGRGLTRDFGEVANLQVSRKGPGDFVSNADRKAEDIIRAEVEKARPGWGFLMEESGEMPAPTASTAGSSTRSTAPPTSCTVSRSSRSRSRSSARGSSSPGWSTTR
jgi:3'-phosphoadenosine 5'-phosphosulfate (PAPS) 3'-phosphatase